MKVAVVTGGSRGDVQPYIALAVGLREAGHEPLLTTHEYFRPMVEERGLEFAPLAGDPREAVFDWGSTQRLVDDGFHPVKYLRRGIELGHQKLGRLWDDTFAACEGADAVIYAMWGWAAYHAAGHMGIPAIHANWGPNARTRELPNVMLSALTELIGSRPRSNLLTHAFLEQAFWLPFSSVVNERRRALGMTPIGREGIYSHLLAEQHPCLFGYSSSSVPKPRDWQPWHHVTGYWFLDLLEDYSPPPGLEEFLDAGPPPVFVGFGSMVADDEERAARTHAVIEAVESAGQRAVLECSGGAIGGVDLPETMHYISNVPYEWLWPRVAAVVHHGGAGSTAAGLRFGRPTVICPFAGDQFFWGQRVARMGAGPEPVPIRKLTAEGFAEALRVAVSDTGIRERAAQIGAQIQAEHGVRTAVELFERYSQRRFPARPVQGATAQAAQTV